MKYTFHLSPANSDFLQFSPQFRLKLATSLSLANDTLLLVGDGRIFLILVKYYLPFKTLEQLVVQLNTLFTTRRLIQIF